jgi:hypothetical protein
VLKVRNGGIGANRRYYDFQLASNCGAMVLQIVMTIWLNAASVAVTIARLIVTRWFCALSLSILSVLVGWQYLHQAVASI